MVSSRSSVRFLSLGFLLASCAAPLSPVENAVGKHVIAGEERPFTSQRDLLVYGLMADAMGLATSTRYFEAESRFRRALYLDPTNEKIEFSLALVLDQVGQSDEALARMESLVSRFPERPDYKVGLAGVLLSTGSNEEAVKRLKEAFKVFKDNSNFVRASLIARSISNISFGFGLEQESLCYSFEAYTLNPTDEQLGRHTLLLVGLNLGTRAVAFVEQAGSANSALVRRGLVQYAVALAHASRGDFDKALDAAVLAKDYMLKDAELGLEVNVLEWLLKERIGARGDTERTLEAHEEFRGEVVNFKSISNQRLIFWPGALRMDLATVVDEDA